MPRSHMSRMVLVVMLAALGSCRFTSADDPKDGPCGKRCEGALPYCNQALKACVACLESAHCEGVSDNAYCHEPTGQCVGCLESSACTDAEAAVCGEDTTCQPCTENEECAHLGLAVCDDGTCRACTVQTEAVACGLNACDPATHTCTDTQRGSVGLCDACHADSECQDSFLCVPMQFSPEGGPLSQLGGYCLREKPTDSGCDKPFSSAIARTTLSGLSGKTFCAVAEPLTTCQAVLDLIEDVPKPCSDDTDCGLSDLDDGICDTPNVGGCTYACTSGAQCPDDHERAAGDHQGGGHVQQWRRGCCHR